jgi:branched-chain amino acid transport system ATP-binding protein
LAQSTKKDEGKPQTMAMTALLEVKNLHKRYGAVVVADDVGFSIEPRACIGLIGPNGAGKSSLFDMLTGIVAADAGLILFEGRNILRLAAHLRARLGIVRAFQIPRPFTQLSVYENVLTAASYGAGLSGPTAQRQAIEALAMTGLLQQAEIAGGHLRLLDRKRLELAKAIASNAKLLLLDEIASGLTEQEVIALVELIAGLKANHAIIWIEHIPHALREVADRIMVLHFGRKLLDDTPPRVLTSPMIKEIYMGLPADAA